MLVDRVTGAVDGNGVDEFGDGSNRWIDGTREFLSDPGQLVRDPYDTVAGAADAATLNFDEGVGGIFSLFDAEPGNTAGPGQSPLLEAPRDGQPSNPGTTGSPLLDGLYRAALLAGGLYVAVNVGIPLLQIVAELVGGD
jgi:hypothetical protein